MTIIADKVNVMTILSMSVWSACLFNLPGMSGCQPVSKYNLRMCLPICAIHTCMLCSVRTNGVVQSSWCANDTTSTHEPHEHFRCECLRTQNNRHGNKYCRATINQHGNVQIQVPPRLKITDKKKVPPPHPRGFPTQRSWPLGVAKWLCEDEKNKAADTALTEDEKKKWLYENEKTEQTCHER